MTFAPIRRYSFAIGICLLLLTGVFLRLPDHLFRGPGAPLHFVAALHPAPGFTGVGFDENLYRGYVNDLAGYGVTAYPDFAERYVEIQSRLPSAILPPTRFLYIFCAYLWHLLSGTDALTALHDVSSIFGIGMLGLSSLFACRLGGRVVGLSVTALMAFAPTQIHMTQHALIDGFFAFWATLSLWLLWENLQKPNDWRWLLGYALSLALLVVTKENAMFVYIGLLALLAANHWLRFGQITRNLLVMTLVGPLAGAALLVNLCGSLEMTFRVYLLLVSKASVLPYAIATGDGPWYRYLVDLMLISPVVLVLAIGGIFTLRRDNRAALYLLVFVVASYLLMANVRYGMNLRYANIWDLPLRYLVVTCLGCITMPLGKNGARWAAVGIAIVCTIELRQYVVFFVQHGLYELVTEGLLRAVRILK